VITVKSFVAYVSLLLPITASAAVIHVPEDQPTIQAGINSSIDGDTVLVADGEYTGEGNINLKFGGRAIIVRSINGAEHCTIDIQGDLGENRRAFVFFSNEDVDSIVQGFTITGGAGTLHGGGIFISSASPTIRNCIITGNEGYDGAGIFMNDTANPRITDCIISNNVASNVGGGICCLSSSTPRIRFNIISGNSAHSGAGIYCYNASPAIIEMNLFVENSAWFRGGAILCRDNCQLAIASNTFCENSASESGGGIFFWDTTITVTNTILWNNQAPEGAEIGGIGPTIPVSFSAIQGGYPGEGNIDADPLFTSGLLGDHYLQHVAAGQPVDSPCVDSGDPVTDIIRGTTRTDQVQDQGVPDIGYRYPMVGLVAGPGNGEQNEPLVRVFPARQAGDHAYEFSAYGAPHFGVNITCGDVDGDQMDEILTGAGPGPIFGPHVRSFKLDGTPVAGLSFLAYGTNRYGVNVAAGDIDGDGYDEIITGAGPGAVFGPHVRAWNFDGSGSVTAIPEVSYFAYGTPKWGVNVSAGDIDGDGFDEIVTGAGPGAVYGPHVRGWNVDGALVTPIPGVSFFAYGTNKFGVNVTCGDLNGDGMAELVTGAGPGALFGAHVRGWSYDGTAVTELPGINFFAWPPAEARYGANVFAGADLDGNGRDDLVVGCGPDPAAGTPVKVYLYDGTQVTEWFSLEAFPGMAHGANVAAGRF